MRRAPGPAILLLALVAAACSAGVTPPASAPGGTSEPGATASARPSDDEPSATASASVPDLPEPPPAGLALVREVAAGSPVTQVFVVEADGSLRQVTGLTGDSVGATGPMWSPDGTMLAFDPPKVGAGLDYPVGVVNADGSGERVIGSGANPRWSPDGSRILFVEVDDVTSEPRSIYIVDASGGEVREVTTGANPRWLPDGERISFEQLFEGAPRVLYVMPADGGAVTQLATESSAAWSPDGTALLLTQESGVWLAELDGSGARRLAAGYDPVWSPDATRIVLADGYDANGQPLQTLIDRDGRIIWSGVSGASPTWSPDGTRIAVESGTPTSVIKVVDASSGDVVWEIEGADPAWSPA